MPLLGFFVVFLLFASLGVQQCVKGDQVSDFLDEKEKQVLQIANLSQYNYEHTCEFLASCSDECTRGACAPLLSDELSCTYVAENANCHADPSDNTSSACTNILVNFERSYVRTPRGILSGASDDVPSEMTNAICSQRKLDPLFRELQTVQNASEYFFYFYFGSIDGSFRAYPGVEAKDCFNYDPRIRPWYTGAISVVKDLVVLLDTGGGMSDPLALATFQASILQAAQNTTEQLLKTLTPNDRASVISFNDSAQATLLDSPYIVPDAGLSTSDPHFQQLLLTVNSTTSSSNSNAPSGKSNFTAALNQALRIFDTNPLSNALKIVVLITDGTSNPNITELNSVIQTFLSQSVKLLIYDAGGQDNPALRDLACATQGLLEKPQSTVLLNNPLYAISSYFTLLARSQRDTPDGTRPIWIRVYTDYGNLGNVITVAFAAMSADGSELVGVAGIDIQIDGMGVNVRSALDNDIVSSRRYEITNNSIGANITDCHPADNSTVSNCKSDILTPLCVQDDTVSDYASMVCCADCGIPGTSKHHLSIIVIAVATVVPVLVAIVVAVLLWYKCRRCWVAPSNYDNFVKIPKFTYESLSVATNKFSDDNKLGEGTFGTVYKGVLDDGTPVAIKKLLDILKYGIKDFEAEIKVLATANHTNLVALRGFCIDQHHLLVYEFVENGDLDNWLFDKPDKENKVLPWKYRVIIAKGMARGLSYLHEELQNQQKVFHSDIKPANILLDGEFNPKVADFGMAKLYNCGSEIFASGGTKGYIAPEIQNGAPATTRTDVYSYGMVLLELVSGRKCSDRSIGANLPVWASSLVDEGRDFEVVDPLLGNLEEDDMEMAKKLVGIALQCTSTDPEERPEMSTVVKMIEGFLFVDSLPRSFHGSNMSDVNSTFATEAVSLGLSRPRSEKSPTSHSFMDLFHRRR